MNRPNKKNMIFNTYMTKKQAIAMYKSEWWRGKTAEEIVKFQLFEERLCTQFSVYQKAVEEVLGRPVWTHEFAWLDLLQQEYLGKREKPTLTDVMSLLPKDKTIVMVED